MIEYSQIAINNINCLLKLFNSTLNSLFVITLDNIYNIDSNDEKIKYLEHSLTLFNEIPKFSCFNFEITNFVEHFSDLLVHGAIIIACAGKDLQNNMPTISQIMQSKWEPQLSKHLETVKYVKSEYLKAIND